MIHSTLLVYLIIGEQSMVGTCKNMVFFLQFHGFCDFQLLTRSKDVKTLGEHVNDTPRKIPKTVVIGKHQKTTRHHDFCQQKLLPHWCFWCFYLVGWRSKPQRLTMGDHQSITILINDLRHAKILYRGFANGRIGRWKPIGPIYCLYQDVASITRCEWYLFYDDM